MLTSWKVESCHVYKDGGSEDSYKQVDTDENGDSSEDDQETDRIWLLHTRRDTHIQTQHMYATIGIHTLTQTHF